MSLTFILFLFCVVLGRQNPPDEKLFFCLINPHKVWFYNSNWGQKSKTRVSYWWSCISLFLHVFSVKTSTYFPTIHSSTYNLQVENSFCLIYLFIYLFIADFSNFALLVTHKEKHQSRMLVDLKTLNSRQPVFRPELPPAPSTRKWPVREAKFSQKTIPVETQTLTLTVWSFGLDWVFRFFSNSQIIYVSHFKGHILILASTIHSMFKLQYPFLENERH